MTDSQKSPIARIGHRLKALPRKLPVLTAWGESSDESLARQYDAGLSIPVCDQTTEETEGARLREKGRFMARQEMWDELGGMIRDHDHAREATPGGTALADLLSYGARSDVVLPVETALSDPGLMSAHAPREGMIALEEVLQDHPDDYGVALVVAQAHVDIGWAWRGQGWISEVPEKHWEAFHRHFDRAEEILDRFDAFAEDSPALAAARCALLASTPAPKARVADDYEDLIDLDPGNPRHMRGLGNHLLPRWFGSYEQLELEARRTAARTGDIWGAGAYTWVYLDALAVDPVALGHLDVPFFLDGMRDILTHRPDQHYANQMAAFCAVTLQQPRYGRAPDSQGLREIRAALDWILRDHLTELHPLVWGVAAKGAQHATGPLARDEVARLGRDCALARIGRHFDAELRRGMRVVFDRTGPHLEPMDG